MRYDMPIVSCGAFDIKSSGEGLVAGLSAVSLLYKK